MRFILAVLIGIVSLVIMTAIWFIYLAVTAIFPIILVSAFISLLVYAALPESKHGMPPK